LSTQFKDFGVCLLAEIIIYFRLALDLNNSAENNVPFNSEHEKGIHVSGVDPLSTQLQRPEKTGAQITRRF
jgi:hypothetical protein